MNGAGQTRCISIYDCQPLLDLIKKQQNYDSVKRAQCGFIGDAPAVCCPQAAREPQCSTPDGKPGRCIDVYSCPALLNLLKQPIPAHVISYVESSKCDGPAENSACCGPAPILNKPLSEVCAAQTAAQLPDPGTECCGMDGAAGNKIVGGVATAVDEYPWMVLIEHKSGGSVLTPCGGVLISARYVLTAAHCVTERRVTVGRPTHIRLGEYDTGREGPDCVPVEAGGEDCTEGALSIPIEKIIAHPQYEPKSTQKRNDIALIRMRRPAPFTDFIRPICLPSQDMTLRTKPFNLTAAGWGTDDTEQNSPIKLQVQLPYVTRERCAPNTTIGTLWKGQLCAGGLRGQDSCRGDSGGPLMFENGRQYEVIGIVSVGAQPCGLESIPGVYTNVYQYISWIKTNIQ